ncbi:hypothetical protein AGLY_016656, partial [Aphis glycines]
MKAKRKIGTGCKWKREIKKNNAKKKRKPNKKNGGMRFISTPRQTGGVIPLVPIFAGLSVLGSLMSGGASKGSHWVAFYKNKDKVVYFDSFGYLTSPIELQKYLKGNKIKYNYTNYQNKNTFNCGHLCLIFLQCKNHLTGNTTTLSVHYFPPIDVYDDSEIALLNLQTYNTFPNINETNNHFEIHLVNPDRLLNNNKFPTCFITLKKEYYDIKDIKNQILAQINNFNNDLEYLEIEKITFDIGIDQVDFRTTIFSNGTICFNVENSIAPLLGFEKKNYEQYIDGHRSQKVSNLNIVNSIKVMCNIAQGSFNNHMSSHSIYEFSPSENIGSKLIQTPSNLIYYKLNKTNIESLTIQLVDQDHNPINNLVHYIRQHQLVVKPNKMPESDILDISSQYETDSKITKIEFHSYTPYTTSFKNNDEIRISIQQTDVYPYLHESFIYLEGKITEAGKVLLSNNGFSYLFDKIRLEINGIEVDSIRVLGITSSLKGYLSGTPVDYYCYENAGWTFKNNTKSTNNAGEFSASIPLKYWLGLFEDFKKILVNSRLELILTRSHSDLNAINVKSEGSATTGAVTLNKIVWKVPHITVDDEERLKLLKLVEKEKSLFIPFRSFETFEYPELGTTSKAVWNLKTASKLEKPRFIIVGLQKDRKNQISKDCSVFDKCDLTNVKVFLNSLAYPYDNLNLDFNKNNFSILYDMYTSFQESYYEKKIRNPLLSPSTFLENAPIVVIDTSKQNDSGTASSVDVQLEIEASKPLTGVSAYCLLIHDRIVEYVPFTREWYKKCVICDHVDKMYNMCVH